RGLAQTLDASRQRPGQWRTGGARLPRPLRLPCRSHQRPDRRPRRPNGHDPIQGPQDRLPTYLSSQRRRVYAPLPPTCAAARLPQSPLLRPVASRATPERRPDTADAATAGAFEDRLDTRRPCRSTARTTRRGAGAADRAADVSALSGAAGLHPHAHPAAGHGAMIRGTRHHHGSVLLVRVPPRHGGPLLSVQFTAITLTRMRTGCGSGASRSLLPLPMMCSTWLARSMAPISSVVASLMRRPHAYMTARQVL